MVVLYLEYIAFLDGLDNRMGDAGAGLKETAESKKPGALWVNETE